MVKRKMSILVGVLSGLFVLSGCGDLGAQSTNYKEFVNGFELEAQEHTIECEINGDCQQTYKCNKKTKQVMSGNINGVPQYTTRTTWDECPHATHETTYTVKTTAGDIVYAENLRTGEYFQDKTAIPATEEPPESWVGAKERLENGESRPVTVLKDTQREPHKLNISEELQESIDSLEKDWFLPYFPDKTSFDGKVDKAHFVHYEPDHDYNEDLAYLNGALAIDEQDIDVHVVFVHDNLDIEPELYTESLVTYWQQDRPGSTSLHPHNLVLVMGVDPEDQVTWVQTHTGHISDGERISDELEERLSGTVLDESFVGRPSYDVETGTVMQSDGILETVLWNSLQE